MLFRSSQETDLSRNNTTIQTVPRKRLIVVRYVFVCAQLRNDASTRNTEHGVEVIRRQNKTTKATRENQGRGKNEKIHVATALCTFNATSRICSSSSAPSHSALSASAIVRALRAFWRAVRVGCSTMRSCNYSDQWGSKRHALQITILTWVSNCEAEYPSLTTSFTVFLIVSNPFTFETPSTSISFPSIPNAAANLCTTWSGTTPAISWISACVIGVRGVVLLAKRDADWR